jgi:catechol 2,3-dioxygenase-like lactoylglutathione lyase family enzyme
VLTLGVDDLERSLAFCRDGLGLPTKGIVGREFEHGAVAFFDLRASAKLAIWPRDDLAYDTGLRKSPRSSTEFSIGQNVRSEQEVDAVMQQAERAGAKVIKRAQKIF